MPTCDHIWKHQADEPPSSAVCIRCGIHYGEYVLNVQPVSAPEVGQEQWTEWEDARADFVTEFALEVEDPGWRGHDD
jgi:hypothetical protein